MMTEEKIEIAIGIDLIKDAGYAGFVAFFYGGADSGSFEETYAIPETIICEESGNLLVDRYSNHFADVTKDAPEVHDKLIDGIPSAYYQEHDWWNNAGGSGYIVIDLENMRYYTEYNLNGERINEPELDENGEEDWDNFEPKYEEYVENGFGDINF